MTAVVDAPSVDIGRTGARRASLWRVARQPAAALALTFLVVVVLGCVFAPLVTSYGPLTNDLGAVLQGPGSHHLLGTDQLGRDVFSRLLYGGRQSLIGVAEAIAVAVTIGIPAGAASGFLGGWVDSAVSRLVEVALAVPAIIVVLMALSVFGQNQNAAMIVLGVLFAPGLTRVARAATLAAREELYVAAARTSGLTSRQIIRRHILPSIAGPVTVNTALLTASALLAQTGLSFLGLGVRDPDPSWGGMVASSAETLNRQAFSIVPAGAVIALTCLSFIVLGDAVRDADRAGRATVRAPSRSRPAPSSSSSPDVVDPGSKRSLLEVSELSVELPLSSGWTTVVDRVSFSVQPGETVGLVGESGCGKTVTALSLLGLIPAGGRIRSGRVSLQGDDLAAASERQLRAVRGDRIAYIAQEPMVSLDPSFTIGSQLTEVVRGHDGGTRRAARPRVLELLGMAGISDPQDIVRRFPHQISGGMAQRVVIARALAGRPSLLLADEPTTALDATIQAEILELLRQLLADTGMAMILVTHDWGVVADICDRAVVMYAGQVVESADVDAMFDHPLHPYTRALLAADPHRVADGTRIQTIEGRVPAPGAWPSGCRFADRCSITRPDCTTSPVALLSIGQSRRSRCLHSDELAAPARSGGGAL